MADRLHERDFYEWSVENARLLREGRVLEADLSNIAQEIEDIGVSQRWELATLLRRLIQHMLTPHREGCAREIREFRRQIEDLLERMPSLSRFIDEEIARAYAKSREDVIDDRIADAAIIPVECPWSQRQILDLHFLPEPEDR